MRCVSTVATRTQGCFYFFVEITIGSSGTMIPLICVSFFLTFGVGAGSFLGVAGVAGGGVAGGGVAGGGVAGFGANGETAFGSSIGLAALGVADGASILAGIGLGSSIGFGINFGLSCGITSTGGSG
jgi:hypothetical protein